jgi:GT2 family glycosyltransferase
VAVAIVNANSGQFLRRALTALQEQSLRPDKTVVVDNASVDGSADNLEQAFRDVELIRLDENVGFAAANNVVMAETADVDWLALLNPDAFPEPRWLEELLRAAEQQPGYSFFASRIVMADDPDALDAAGDALHVSGIAWQCGHGEPAASALFPREVFSASAAAALYRRDALVEVGGFDNRFFCYYEDTDLGFRLRLAGHRCWYVPGAVVHHVGSATALRESDFMLYHTHRNLVWTYAKNMPTPLAWLYLPQHVLVNVLTVIALALKRRFRVALRAKIDAVRGLPAILRDRRAVQRTRVATTRELHAAMARGLEVLPVLTRRSRELAAASPREPAERPPSKPA